MELEVLIPEEKIKDRVKDLSLEISQAFNNDPIVIISILKGAIFFTVDLLRYLNNEVMLDFIRIKSYEGETKKDTKLAFLSDIPLEGRNVLIVDDIFDTGESLKLAYDEVKKRSPKLIKTCVLLDKEIEKKVKLKPDFVGFRIPNFFVVGYGLDINEKYRNLPYIGYFKTRTLK
ncbi:MAG: hypoxanthine phosphoribosyltransferase [Desulfurobacteriaceae bacterium]